MLQSKQAIAVAKEYSSRVRAFKPNARLYLSSVIITGAAMGVYRLLFNFYALSLGYDEALLGNLVTVSSLTALLAALPMGYLSDLIGRKASLVIAGIMLSASIFVVVFWQGVFVLYAMNVLSGLAQSLTAVTNAPFLMENSGEQERTYLFSFSMGLQMAMASLGNWIGGYLPSWVAQMRGVSPTSSTAYAGALLVIALIVGIGVIPLFMLRQPPLKRTERSVFAPLSYAAKQPVLLTKLILPMLITSIGAGMIMPFMNVFFRHVYHQPDPVIGTLFAWGSLAMGVGLLIAPPLAERMGKIQLVVVTQALSIPFLIILGFAPVFWMSALAYYVRLALMNMSSPVYQTFVMEHVEPSARATVASLVSMAWNFGWAFSPSISGWMQVTYGFGPPYLATIFLYTVSIFLYWVFFWRGLKKPQAIPIPCD
jgi:MFS family permease